MSLQKTKKENIYVAVPVEKQQRKRKAEKNGRQMKRQVQVYENFKLEDYYLLIKFK